MFEPGQKVICVDDTAATPGVMWRYRAWPVKGCVYTVRDIVPGIEPGRQETVSVYLVELVNPENRHGIEYGFGTWRFDTLEEFEDVNIEKRLEEAAA